MIVGNIKEYLNKHGIYTLLTCCGCYMRLCTCKRQVYHTSCASWEGANTSQTRQMPRAANIGNGVGWGANLCMKRHKFCRRKRYNAGIDYNLGRQLSRVVLFCYCFDSDQIKSIHLDFELSVLSSIILLYMGGAHSLN